MSFVFVKQLVMAATTAAPQRRRSSILHDNDADLESTSVLIPKYELDHFRIPRGPIIPPRLLSDATIGLADGLTVPFALTAGLATLQSTRLVVLAGLAELVSGAISMALGGYLGALSEGRARKSERSQVRDRVHAVPVDALAQASDLLGIYFPSESVGPLLSYLASGEVREGDSSSEAKLVRLLLLLELGHTDEAQTDEENAGISSRAWSSAGTIGASYFLGGLVPLLPYMLVSRDGAESVRTAFAWSVGVMAIALALFGWIKSAVVGGWSGRQDVSRNAREAIVMVFVGGAAAAMAMGCVLVLAGGEVKTR